MTAEWLRLERRFEATLEEVWELWATKDGIESWWGPDGFRVEVVSLDLRPGGLLVYDMIAEAPDAIAQMERQGMPVRQRARIVYREVLPLRRLSYLNLVEFIPQVEPYEVETIVTLEQVGPSVRMKLEFAPMHDETWRRRAAAGWAMELDRLARRLAERARQITPRGNT